jgi:membrane protein
MARTASFTASPPPKLWPQVLLASLIGAAALLDQALKRRRQRRPNPPAQAGPLDLRPWRWRRALVSATKESAQDHIQTVAAGVTFYGVLALFPAIGAFVSLYGLSFDVEDAGRQLTALAGLLPRSLIQFLGEEMERIASARHSGLSVGFAVGLAFSLWSANAGMKAIFAALNVAYEVKETRSFLRLNLISLAFTAAVIALAALAAAAAALAPRLLAASLDPGPARLLAWPLLIVAMLLALAVLYRYGPARGPTPWRWITPGSLVATLTWLAASAGFSWYLASFGHYEKTYGSLGAIVGAMMWIWITVTVILFGAELNLEVEREAAGAGARRS